MFNNMYSGACRRESDLYYRVISLAQCVTMCRYNLSWLPRRSSSIAGNDASFQVSRTTLAIIIGIMMCLHPAAAAR